MILRQGPGAPALAAAVALLVAGCGEKRETTTGGASSPAAGLTVSETEFRLSPPSAQVDPAGGVSITVKDDGSVAHALEVDGPSGTARTGTIAPGATATLSVNLSTPGTYTMFCPIDGHRQKGMKGEIRVG